MPERGEPLSARCPVPRALCPASIGWALHREGSWAWQAELSQEASRAEARAGVHVTQRTQAPPCLPGLLSRLRR